MYDNTILLPLLLKDRLSRSSVRVRRGYKNKIHNNRDNHKNNDNDNNNNRFHKSTRKLKKKYKNKYKQKYQNKYKSLIKHNENNIKKGKGSKTKTKCDKGTSFQDCELAILRSAVDRVEKQKGIQRLQNDTIRNIISIVEQFIKKKKCICYGGTAINNILPKYDQFYNKDVEFPDYDFFSPKAYEHAKELADIYAAEGFVEVMASAGMHEGTYKVYVNFIPVADITYMQKELFENVKKHAIVRDGIHYAPANYLRMAMYLELSRPEGDVSRWEKVLKRITLLNKHYPLKSSQCSTREIQRIFESKNYPSEEVFFLMRDILINENVVFFGAYANKMYSRYMPKSIGHTLKKIPDFDVLSEYPLETVRNIEKVLIEHGVAVEVIKHKGVGEIIATHYEIVIDGDTVTFVYEPLACHSYNVIPIGGKSMRIATIDTMLSFYLAFMYSNRPYYDKNRILCMCEFMFKVQQQNRLAQKGLLRRFSIKCIGKQQTIEDIRAHKSEKFKELKNKKGTREYDKVFMRYEPKTTGNRKTKKVSNNSHNDNAIVDKKTRKRKKSWWSKLSL